MTSTSTPSAFSALAPYGWDDAWADAFAPYDAEGLIAGRVVRVDRGRCDVITADGVLRADTAFVTPHDPLRVVCTGDWVAIEPAGNPRYRIHSQCIGLQVGGEVNLVVATRSVAESWPAEPGDAHTGRFCCSMYCLTTESGAPPTVPAK
ncbi:hypothetical protein BIV24_21420 [Streptomyces colonosanans]|uniref:Uncharacterized protein n=1 Tax=Streptomyces colonosanans TaxID=1428652 RepID=A0A1S2P4U2_9ACTN|nr:hypothetical protein BIV24_21420 [Streptomyces colonosanans]